METINPENESTQVVKNSGNERLMEEMILLKNLLEVAEATYLTPSFHSSPPSPDPR